MFSFRVFESGKNVFNPGEVYSGVRMVTPAEGMEVHEGRDHSAMFRILIHPVTAILVAEMCKIRRANPGQASKDCVNQAWEKLEKEAKETFKIKEKV